MKQKPRQRIGYFPEHASSEQPATKAGSIRRRLNDANTWFKRVNIVRLATLFVCAAVFCTCSFLLARYLFDIASSRSAARKLENIHQAAQQEMIMPSESPTAARTVLPTATRTSVRATAAPSARNSVSSHLELWPTVYPDNPTLRVSPVFYQLQAQNKDIIGWLKIDGVLEEAVVQRDNEYYLTHNVLQQRSVTGALFLDEACDLSGVPTQMLIHGHNMKEGAMFGSLKKYKVKDASYYRAHPFVDFNTIYENGRYVIFAVAEVDIRSSKPDYLPFWHQSRFYSADSFMQYVDRARLLSHYQCNVDVQPGDRLLTLSTCTGNDDNKRLIVMARKLRKNENEFELNMSILSSSDR